MLRARVQHATQTWLILTHCSNALNTLKRTAVLSEADIYVPVLTPLAVKCCGETSTPLFFQVESGERRKVGCSSGIQSGDAVGPALFRMPILPMLNRIRAEVEPRGIKAFCLPR